MTQELSLFTNLLGLGNSFITWIVALLIIAPAIIGIIRKVFDLHTNDLLFRKVNHFESSLSKLDNGSDDYELFKEALAQELFYANTRLILSKHERAQIKEWTISGMVPMNYIQMAWPNIVIKKARLMPEITLIDKIYAAWILIAILTLSVLNVYLVFLFTTHIESLSVAVLLSVTILLEIIVIRDLRPIYYARKIQYRLNQSGLLSDEP